MSTSSPSIPRLVITAGEPAGIGPDVVIMAAQREWPAELLCIADSQLLRQRAEQLGLPLTLRPFTSGEPARGHQPGELVHIDVPLRQSAVPGVLNTANAEYVLATLTLATELCRAGDANALVTAPVQKSVINDAGITFSGHTEFLAELTDTPKVVMLLAAGQLRVALATTHLPLAHVAAAITAAELESVLKVLSKDLKTKFGLASPRVAVLGLNPHAGEGGHLGREEIEVITPTLDKLGREGFNLEGPLPADTAFNPDIRERTDAYLAMYHDQGLPVLKYAGFGEAVNITLGLPFIRTSVDHGTALALAGTGRADAGSLCAAVQTAIDCARRTQA